MEPSRVELLSKLGNNFPLIHRFIPSSPQGGNYLLSQIVGCLQSSLNFLGDRRSPRESIRWGYVHSL